MTAFDTLRAIAARPEHHAQPEREPTAREIIEARIGRKLPPTADCPPDIRAAIRELAIARLRARYGTSPHDRAAGVHDLTKGRN